MCTILPNKRVICKLIVPLLYQQTIPISHSNQPIRASMQINPTKMATTIENRREAWVSQATEEAKLSTHLASPDFHSKATKFQLWKINKSQIPGSLLGSPGLWQPANHHRPLAQDTPCSKGTLSLIQDTLQGKPAGPHPCTRPISYLIKK